MLSLLSKIRCTVIFTGILALRSYRSQRHGRAILAAAFVGMLCACAPATLTAQVATKKSYNLSANSGDVELFRVDPKVWTDINRFVFTVGFDYHPPTATDGVMVDDFSTIPVYPQLRNACQQWGNHTFGNIQQLATELSTGEIPRLLTDLKSAVDRWPTDPEGAQKAFSATASVLVPRLGQLQSATASVKRDLESLSTLTLAASVQNQKNDNSRKIVPRLRDVVAPLAAMYDHWSALNSDLAALKTEMDTHLRARDPFDLQISVDIGLASWAAVEAAAKTFVTDFARQQKYLSGENYYEECPIKERTYYVIQVDEGLTVSSYRVSGQLLSPPPKLTDYAIVPKSAGNSHLADYSDLPPDSTTLGASPLERSKAAALGKLDGWLFERQGLGWWRIAYNWSTMPRGPSEYDEHVLLLDVWRSGAYLYPQTPPRPKREFALMSRYTINAPGSSPLGQLWRCTPTERPGHFRLHNALLGISQPLSYGMAVRSIPRSFGKYELQDWVGFSGAERYANSTDVWRIQALPAKAP